MPLVPSVDPRLANMQRVVGDDQVRALARRDPPGLAFEAKEARRIRARHVDRRPRKGARLFDYVLNFGKATRPLLLLPVGLAHLAQIENREQERVQRRVGLAPRDPSNSSSPARSTTRARERKHSREWSFTIPTACMNA